MKKPTRGAIKLNSAACAIDFRSFAFVFVYLEFTMESKKGKGITKKAAAALRADASVAVTDGRVHVVNDPNAAVAYARCMHEGLGNTAAASMPITDGKETPTGPFVVAFLVDKETGRAMQVHSKQGKIEVDAPCNKAACLLQLIGEIVRLNPDAYIDGLMVIAMKRTCKIGPLSFELCAPPIAASTASGATG